MQLSSCGNERNSLLFCILLPPPHPKRNWDNEASPATMSPLIFDAERTHTHTHTVKRRLLPATYRTSERLGSRSSLFRRSVESPGEPPCVSSYTWPTSCCDSHMSSLRQQPFVTVLLIMLMHPPPPPPSLSPCSENPHIKDIKEKGRANGTPRSRRRQTEYQKWGVL